MRRKEREVTDYQKIIEIVNQCDIVRLGLSDGDYPYVVPVNFAYEITEGKLFFYIHGAKAGKKYEMLCNHPQCSFEMDIPIQIDCNVKKKAVTMKYKSVMGRATATFLEGEEKQRAIDTIIMARYEETRNFEYNRDAVPHTAVVRLEVTEITAKQTVE